VRKVIETASVFYVRFGFLDKHQPKPDPKETKNRGRLPRIPPSSTLCSLSGVLIETPRFVGRTFEIPQLTPRVLDTLFRGDSLDVLRCMQAMQKVDYAADLSELMVTKE
jgi:hypothetical protein